jgi:hypothetical protein
MGPIHSNKQAVFQPTSKQADMDQLGVEFVGMEAFEQNTDLLKIANI